MRALLVLLLLISSYSFAAEDCAFRLAGDRYWSAVRECLRKGILSDGDLEKIAVSERPFNPYAHTTPLSKTATAFRVFVNLLADPQVQMNWDTTRAFIKDTLKERHKVSATRDAAHHQTKDIINPREIKSFAGAEQLSAAVLENGVPFLAYIVKPQTLKILRMTDGEEVYSGLLPDIEGNDDGKRWAIKWHTENDGKVRLYLSASKTEDNKHFSTLIFRFDLSHPLLEQLPYEIDNALNERLESAAPGMLYVSVLSDVRHPLTTKRHEGTRDFDMTAAKSIMVRIFNDHIQPEPGIFFDHDNPAVVKDGKVIPFQVKSNDGGYHLLKRNGQIIRCYDHFMQIQVRLDGDPNFKYSIDYPPDASMIGHTTMFETKDGRVLLAGLFYQGTGMKAWTFYEIGKPKQISSVTPGHYFSEHAWIEDQNGDPLFLTNLAGQKFSVTLNDPLTGRELYRSESPESLVDALQVGKQVYFWTVLDDKFHLYSLFNAPN